MYLRVTKRTNANGSVVSYYQLADNVWDRKLGCAVAHVVYNFGRADQVDPDKLRRLASSILRLLPAEQVLAAEPDVRVVDARPYGGLHVLDHLWRELGIDRVLEAHVRSRPRRSPLARAVFAMVANRALAPCSKLCCYEQWLREDVFFAGWRELELHHLYRAMDLVDEHRDDIEREVYFRTADLMNADVDLIFYDTTSLHFEVDREDEDDSEGTGLRKRGHAKNGRTDAPQIVVGLAVTRDGLPVRSWVWPGNTTDVTTIEKVKADLRGWKLGRCVLVGDAGMNSEENRRTLSLGGGKYILASRMRQGDEVSTVVLTRPGRYHEVADNLRVKEVFVGDGERRRRYVVCHNPQEAERQQRHREELLADLEAELSTLSKATSKQEHSKRVCALRASGRFGRYLRIAGDGRPAIDRAHVADAARLDGKWVVTSNDDTLTAEDLALGYKQLLRVEQCWRTMKSGLRMRPVYHWTPPRVRAHVTLCMLALLLERIAEKRASNPWRSIATALDTIKVVEYVRGEARVRQTTELRPEAQQLLAKLAVPPPPRLHTIEETLPASTESAAKDTVDPATDE